MTITTPLYKGTAVPADKLEIGHDYNVATDEGLMHAKFVGKEPDSPRLVFSLTGGYLREKLVHPNSLFFDPDRIAEEHIEFDPDDPDDESFVLIVLVQLFKFFKLRRQTTFGRSIYKQ